MSTGNAEMRLTLRKGEKLRHRSLVNNLFKEGNSLYEFPLRLIWRTLTPEQLDATFRNHPPEKISALQMLITVPKKKRKRAVDRVLLRRRIREAYRLNRTYLKKKVEANKKIATLSIAFIYMHNDITDYAIIEKKMKNLLSKLERRFTETSPEE